MNVYMTGWRGWGETERRLHSKKQGVCAGRHREKQVKQMETELAGAEGLHSDA